MTDATASHMRSDLHHSSYRIGGKQWRRVQLVQTRCRQSSDVLTISFARRRLASWPVSVDVDDSSISLPQ